MVGFRDDIGQIEDDGGEVGISSKQPTSEMAMASADIAQGADCGQIEAAQGGAYPLSPR